MTRLALAVAAFAAALSALAPAAGLADSELTVSYRGKGSHGTEFRAHPAPVTATAAALRRPRGTYTGRNGTLTLLVSGRSIDLASFDFRCGDATGRTGLNDVAIVRRRGRYRFSIRAHGITTYSDDVPDENAAIRLAGRFTPRAARAIGTFRVRTPRCGSTGDVAWSARR